MDLKGCSLYNLPARNYSKFLDFPVVRECIYMGKFEVFLLLLLFCFSRMDFSIK